MMIDMLRLRDALGQVGFEIAWLNHGDSSALVRPSSRSGLFELIEVGWGGRHGEVVFADAALSVLRGWATKGLVEIERLSELDADAELGWTRIETPQDARRWEGHLAAVAPARCEDLARRIGDQLLDRTASARDAVETYLSLLPRAPTPQEAIPMMKNLCSPDEAASARRLAEWAGVRQTFEHDAEYELATLLIVHFAGSVGKAGEPLDPLANMDLMWRIQLLRDQLSKIFQAH